MNKGASNENPNKSDFKVVFGEVQASEDKQITIPPTKNGQTIVLSKDADVVTIEIKAESNLVQAVVNAGKIEVIARLDKDGNELTEKKATAKATDGNDRGE